MISYISDLYLMMVTDLSLKKRNMTQGLKFKFFNKIQLVVDQDIQHVTYVSV